MTLSNHVRRHGSRGPRRKRPVSRGWIWLIHWASLFDALVGILSLTRIPLNLSSKLAAWTFMQTFETQETKRDNPRRRRKTHRRK